MSDNDDHYDDSHVGEKPVPWPKQSIEELEGTWEADEIVENIEQCRGCCNDHGLCERHQGVIRGYDRATRDMTRVFDLTEDDVPQDTDFHPSQ